MTEFRSDMNANINVEELIDEWMMLQSNREAESEVLSESGDNTYHTEEGMQEQDETCENDEKNEKEPDEDSEEERDDDDFSDVTVNMNMKTNPECRRWDRTSSFYECRQENAHKKQQRMRNRTRKQDRDAKNAYRRGFENGEDNYIY